MALKHILSSRVVLLLASNGIPTESVIYGETIPNGSICIDTNTGTPYLRKNNDWEELISASTQELMYAEILEYQPSNVYTLNSLVTKNQQSINIYVNGLLAIEGVNYLRTGNQIVWIGENYASTSGGESYDLLEDFYIYVSYIGTM